MKSYEEVKPMICKTLDGSEIKAGEFYETRSGQKAFISIVNKTNIYPVMGCVLGHENGISWKETGRFDPDAGQHPLDLMYEWNSNKEDTKAAMISMTSMAGSVTILKKDWIMFNGDKKALADNTPCEVMTLQELLNGSYRKGILTWGAWDSARRVGGDIIIAYKLAKQEKKEKVKQEPWDLAKADNFVLTILEKAKAEVKEKPLPDGWIAYNGTGQPIDDDIECEVLLRGEKDSGDYEKALSMADGWDWNYDSAQKCENDIVGYKIVELKETEKCVCKRDDVSIIRINLNSRTCYACGEPVGSEVEARAATLIETVMAKGIKFKKNESRLIIRLLDEYIQENVLKK